MQNRQGNRPNQGSKQISEMGTMRGGNNSPELKGGVERSKANRPGDFANRPSGNIKNPDRTQGKS